MPRFKSLERVRTLWARCEAPASLALANAALGAWLWFALRRFTGDTGAVWPAAIAPAAAPALIALGIGLHRPGRPWLTAAKALALGALVALAGHLAGGRGWLPLSGGQALWFGGAFAAGAWAARSVLLRPAGPPEAGLGEVLRWLAVGAAATFALLPFYHAGAVGSGDARWYAVMLTDFVTQLRAGVFPVWVGQSPYAFNGAVSPLRYAPGFIYFGGLLDLLSMRCLEPTALKNAVIALVALLGAFSAYACLRPIAKACPWVAAALSVLWILGPGELAPVMTGDQYMTFMTLPFAPLALYGCWRAWQVGDRKAALLVAVGLAGLWNCHSPIALWFTLISAGLYSAAALARRAWAREHANAHLLIGAFLVLGALPFVSVLTLDNQVKLGSSGSAAALQIHSLFPANFLPIRPMEPGLAYYQAGYALLAALAASLLLLFKTRPRGAWAFAAAALFLPVFTVPVPWVTDAFWTHVPVWFVSINNIWPMQRLFLVWSTLIVFAAAIVMGSGAVAASRRLSAALLLAFLPCVLWSVREARAIAATVTPRRSTPEQAREADSPENVILTRYEYSSFSYTPAYFSHGFMDPGMENRLLDFNTLEPMATNEDAAAPADGAAAAAQRLVQSGTWTGTSLTGSRFYLLKPALELDARRRYALRLDFLEPAFEGTLQLHTYGLFREYALPDSGGGGGRRGPPAAFGSGETNSHVMPLSAMGTGPLSPQALYIAPTRVSETLPFARFRLYSYEPKDLPIAVESWIPYKARVQSPSLAFLETPRMWLKGWRASVNGSWTEVSRSPQNLVMFPVPAGRSHVTLVYQPSAALRIAFWAFALGWSGLGALAVCQLVLWTGGRRLSPRWPAGAGAVSGMIGWPARFVWRHRAAAGAIILCAMAALLWRRLGDAWESGSDAAGPMRIEFTLPFGLAGRSQPLLTTGRPGAGTVVYVTYLDAHHVRLGADVWGTQYHSDPIEVNYRDVHSLVVSDTALFPLGSPAVRALSASDTERLRGQLVVELDGNTVIQEPCNAFDTRASEILAGEAPFGSDTDRKFDGEIRRTERLTVPVSGEIAAGDKARLRVRFPKDRTGRSEPMVSLSSGTNSRVCYVTYVAKGEVGVTCCGRWGVPRESTRVRFDPDKEHDFEFHAGEIKGRPGSFDVACTFDGVHLFGHIRPPAAGERTVLTAGLNLGGAPGVDSRFTGPELDLNTAADASSVEPEETVGPEHLVVSLPRHATGRSEPLLSTGVTGAADIIYVKYIDGSHIQVGFDHWAYGGAVSGPIEVNFSVPHDLWISTGALFPSSTDDPAWGKLGPDARNQLRSRVLVTIDGRDALSCPGKTYPSAPGNVVVARNPVGASTCEAEFTGQLVFSERAGAMAPPGAR